MRKSATVTVPGRLPRRLQDVGHREGRLPAPGIAGARGGETVHQHRGGGVTLGTPRGVGGQDLDGGAARPAQVPGDVHLLRAAVDALGLRDERVAVGELDADVEATSDGGDERKRNGEGHGEECRADTIEDGGQHALTVGRRRHADLPGPSRIVRARCAATCPTTGTSRRSRVPSIPASIGGIMSAWTSAGNEAFHILFVEDDERLAALTTRYLESHGHRVTWVADGRQGLAEALKGQHDVVILDLMLPRLSGMEVCRELRQRTHRAGDHAHRAGRGGRPGAGPGDRGRRLPGEALLLARAAGSAARAGSPRPRDALGPTGRPVRVGPAGALAARLRRAAGRQPRSSSPPPSSCCCACWRSGPARCSPASSSSTSPRGAPTRPSTARSTRTSRGCATSWATIRASRGCSRRSAAPATCWSSRQLPRETIVKLSASGRGHGSASASTCVASAAVVAALLGLVVALRLAWDPRRRSRAGFSAYPAHQLALRWPSASAVLAEELVRIRLEAGQAGAVSTGGTGRWWPLAGPPPPPLRARSCERAAGWRA